MFEVTGKMVYVIIIAISSSVRGQGLSSISDQQVQ